MKCEVCGELAVFHVTELDEPGEARQRSFCEEHAVHFAESELSPAGIADWINAGGFRSFARPQDLEKLVPGCLEQFRRVHEFAIVEQRFPTTAECMAIGVTLGLGTMPSCEADSPAFWSSLRYIEQFIAFLETHQRFPNPNEIE